MPTRWLGRSSERPDSDIIPAPRELGSRHQREWRVWRYSRRPRRRVPGGDRSSPATGRSPPSEARLPEPVKTGERRGTAAENQKASLPPIERVQGPDIKGRANG